jgi:hypothetical protein
LIESYIEVKQKLQSDVFSRLPLKIAREKSTTYARYFRPISIEFHNGVSFGLARFSKDYGIGFKLFFEIAQTGAHASIYIPSANVFDALRSAANQMRDFNLTATVYYMGRLSAVGTNNRWEITLAHASRICIVVEEKISP